MGDVAKQGDRNEGERLDLRRQVGGDGLPDPPDTGGCCDGGKPLIEAGGRWEGSCLASARAILVVLRQPPFLLAFARGLHQSLVGNRATIPAAGQEPYLIASAAGVLEALEREPARHAVHRQNGWPTGSA